MKNIGGMHDNKARMKTLANKLAKNLTNDVIIVCIGTDMVIYDAIGPLVGSELLAREDIKCHVYGTIKEPLHAKNVNHHIEEIKKKHPDSFVIAVDAAFGDKGHIGHVRLKEGPVRPGAGLNKNLTHIGDISLIGVVHDSEGFEMFETNSTRLSFIFDLKDAIVDIIVSAFKIYKNNLLKEVAVSIEEQEG